MAVIDTHAHIFPGDFGPPPQGCDPASWPSTEPGPEPGSKFLVNGPMRFPAKAVWFDAEQRLEASAASGLDAELLSPFPALLNYRAPGEVGRDLARVTNEYIAGLVAAYPARLFGLGTVPRPRKRDGYAATRPAMYSLVTRHRSRPTSAGTR